MTFETLISAEELAKHLGDPDWAIVDCRFGLDDPVRGRGDYFKEHIPGAVYADIDLDLSGEIIPGVTGRHPLPSREKISQALSERGIANGVQVVAYDDMTGGMAARLWWLLRWLGHDAVAVLDGGWAAWQRAGLPTTAGEESRDARQFEANIRNEMALGAPQIEALREDPAYKIVDSRRAERYRGEVEPIDPVAGHIPGAVNAPFPENLDEHGQFLSPDILRARFNAVLGDHPADRAVFYCGSGVTAAHNLLALKHAGLGEGLLYAGSWSEWITDPSRPVARGEES